MKQNCQEASSQNTLHKVTRPGRTHRGQDPVWGHCRQPACGQPGQAVPLAPSHASRCTGTRAHTHTQSYTPAHTHRGTSRGMGPPHSGWPSTTHALGPPHPDRRCRRSPTSRGACPPNKRQLQPGGREWHSPSAKEKSINVSNSSLQHD